MLTTSFFRHPVAAKRVVVRKPLGVMEQFVRKVTPYPMEVTYISRSMLVAARICKVSEIRREEVVTNR
jgi:hypothetical protein